MIKPTKNPLFVGANKGSKQHTYNVQTYDTGNFLRRKRFGKKIFNRHALPAPIDYYRFHFFDIPPYSAPRWVSVHCCFHSDKNPSLRLNLSSGGFYCFSCGAKGGDVVDFHMQRYGVPFTAAVTHFGAWTYEK